MRVLISGSAGCTGAFSFFSSSSGTMRVYKNSGVVCTTVVCGKSVVASSVTTVVGRSNVVASTATGILAIFAGFTFLRALSSNVLVSFGTEAIGNGGVAVGRLVRFVVITLAVLIGLLVDCDGAVVALGATVELAIVRFDLLF